MKVCILGTGAYGLALASVINDKNHNIIMWSKIENEIGDLSESYTSEKLPNFNIPKQIKFTNNMEYATKDSDLIIIAVPISFVNNVCEELKTYQFNCPICIASKGIDQETLLFGYDIVNKHFNTDKIAILSGPSFANDIIKKTPTGITLATTSQGSIYIIRQAFENEYFKIKKTNDILGVEICGCLKNILAIATGILFGMEMPQSTIAMFLTESVLNIENLLTALNSNPKTVLSYAGIGDLILTCTSIESRNFTLGSMIGSKQSKLKINNYINKTTIEGLYSLKAIKIMLERKKINMPIINIIYDIIYKNKNCDEILHFLIH